LTENPEVNYAGHPNTYNFLIITKKTKKKLQIEILPLLLNILLDSTKKQLNLYMHKDKYAQVVTREKNTSTKYEDDNQYNVTPRHNFCQGSYMSSTVEFSDFSAALISISLALSQTTAYAAKPRILSSFTGILCHYRLLPVFSNK